ncbi:hypothetical protein [Stenotrophomonas phage vB_SmeS_BUCT700]|uniref:Uncharacterized protein n=1 Tax=Stenotrophomonas phage vB_SmeS_BUCT700 TaxID=2924895 RepID=A0AAE9K6W5_9CAUD|nr:hypothetical protein [Stenotrophomonas phage vB_SmeS_BUCT700]UNY50297.1 hypothetical protein [Stenotrophomonas phage vB_SmeS_BUCT703]
MDAAKLIGDIGVMLVLGMLSLMVLVNWNIAKHNPDHVRGRRSLSYLNYPRIGGIREYLTRFSAAMNGVYGDKIKGEARVVWFFYEFGGFLILANLLYLGWYKIGTLF